MQMENSFSHQDITTILSTIAFSPTQKNWLHSAPTYPLPYFTYGWQPCYETEFCLQNGS